MGLIKLLWDLYYFPRHHEFTPVPDDWPPDGSMHFVKCTDEAQKAVPCTHIQYEFGANVGEDDRRIVKLSMEVMEQLCVSHQVLTEIQSGKEYSKKQRWHPEQFTVRYHRFLENLNASISTYAKNEKNLVILTEGFDATAFWAYKSLDTEDYCFFDFYTFPCEQVFSNAQNAAEAMAAEKYDLWLSLSEYGPCALYITLNPETVDADTIQKIIESTCREHQILFQNPPQL